MPNNQPELAIPFAFAPFAVCDEVRFERGGKHILVGAYPGNQIVVRNFPSLVTCSVWSAFFALRPGPLVGEYQVKNDAAVVASGSNLAFNIVNIDVTECVFGIHFRIEAPAVIEVQIRFNPEDWFTLGSFVVRRAVPEPNLTPLRRPQVILGNSPSG